MTNMKHGTRSMYVEHTCRCEPCQQANRDYQREYLARRRAAGIVDMHGRVLDRSRLTKEGRST